MFSWGGNGVIVSRMVGHIFCNRGDGKRDEEDKVKNIQKSKKEEQEAMRAFGPRLQWIGLGRISTLGRQSAVRAVFAQLKLAYPIQPLSLVITLGK